MFSTAKRTRRSAAVTLLTAAALTSALALSLTSCQPVRQTAFHVGPDYPDKLSAWGVLARQGHKLVIPDDAIVYDLNTPLFTDYALKLRTLHVPQGRSLTFREREAFDAPTGTVISKTFFYRTHASGLISTDTQWDGALESLDASTIRLIETRLLVKQADGWQALPYIWQGDDAHLAITGDLLRIDTSTRDGGQSTLNYVIPSRNQCGSCHITDHTAGHVLPIGLQARHLNRPAPGDGGNQLALLQARDMLQGLGDPGALSAVADYRDEQAPLEARARAYLDINCGHCHNPKGPADTSGLLLDFFSHDLAAMGRCKPPIAAGRGTGGHLYGIVPGDSASSILTFRMASSNPGTMMPEIGRSLVHEEGLSLVSSWIDQLPGACR